MSLRDLPISLSPITNNVLESYVTELKAVMTLTQLQDFVQRWRPLYLLTRQQVIDKKAKDARRFRSTQNNMQKLIDGKWDPKQALECITLSRGGLCKHAKQYSCAGMHILTPMVLLEAVRVSMEYGVSTDLALIQTHGGLVAVD